MARRRAPTEFRHARMQQIGIEHQNVPSGAGKLHRAGLVIAVEGRLSLHWAMAAGNDTGRAILGAIVVEKSQADSRSPHLLGVGPTNRSPIANGASPSHVAPAIRPTASPLPRTRREDHPATPTGSPGGAGHSHLDGVGCGQSWLR